MKPHTWSTVVRGTCVGGGIAIGASAASLGLRAMSGSPTFSIATAAALLTCLGLGVVAWKKPGLGASAAIGAGFALVPNVLFGATWALAKPLAGSAMRCGTADAVLPFTALVTACVACAFAVPVAVLARVIAEDAYRVLLSLAVAVTVGGGIAAAFATTTLQRPEPDAFATVLSDRATVDVGKTATLDGLEIAYFAHGDTCILHISTSTDRNPVVRAVRGCPRLVAQRDPVSGVLVVSRTRAIAEGGAFELVIHDDDAYGAVSPALTLHDLGARLGAPRAWVGGSLLGLLVALGALLGAMIARRREQRLTADVLETAHTGDGWVVVEGVPRHFPELAGADPGPVVVRAYASRPATYRDDGAPTGIVLHDGSREAYAAHLRERAAGWACVAVAAIAMTSAPLWAARLCGLL